MRVGSRIAWLRRRWYVPVVTTLGVPLVAAAIGGAVSTSYSARGLFVVAAGSDRSPSEAQKLGATYADLIPQDSRLTAAIASAIDTTPKDVRNHLVVDAIANTQLLDARYVGRTRRQAIDAVAALDASITGSTPRSPSILPRSVILVRLPDEASAVTSRSPTELPVAALLGMLLGMALVSVLERADARIDDRDDLAEETPAVVSTVALDAPGHLRSVVGRWSRLGKGPATNVVLVPATPRARALSGRLLEMLSTTGATAGVPLVALTDRPPEGVDEDDPRPVLRVSRTSVPGDVDGTDVAVTLADVVVLVVDAGASRRQVRAALSGLAELAVAPNWALLGPSLPTHGPVTAGGSNETEIVTETPEWPKVY
jgi:hypothetical protein